jgi:hypothetical protein
VVLLTSFEKELSVPLELYAVTTKK